MSQDTNKYILAWFLGAGRDKKLTAMGGLLSSVAGLASAVTNALNSTATNAMASGLSARTAGQIASEATLGQVFSNFIGAGFSNLAAIGSSILKLTTSITSLESIGQQAEEEVVDEAEPVDATEITFTIHPGKEITVYDVFGEIGKQFEMY